MKTTMARRLVLLVVLGAAVAVLGAAGWRTFVDQMGGRFHYAPEDAPWVLSDAAQALVAAAFVGLEDKTVADYQVGVISVGQLGNEAIGNDSYYRRDRASQAGPLAWVQTQLRLAGAGVAGVPALDGRYVARLLRQIEAMPGAYRIHLQARGWRYDDAGRRDAAGTYTHVGNAYVWWLAQQAPEIIVPVVSIHPYRPDAVQMLKHWADKGVTAVAWRPLRQNIDLRDPRTRRFYAALAAHDMALHVPVGTIEMVYAPGQGRIDPQALQAALTAGVRLVVSVHGAAATPARDTVVDGLLRLVRGSQGEQLRIALAGVLADDGGTDVLMALLQHPQLHARLRYASGYPLSAVDARIDLGRLAARDFIRQTDVAPLREIYHLNPLLFVFVVLRTVRLPHTQLQLPTAVFTADS